MKPLHMSGEEPRSEPFIDNDLEFKAYTIDKNFELTEDDEKQSKAVSKAIAKESALAVGKAVNSKFDVKVPPISKTCNIVQDNLIDVVKEVYLHSDIANLESVEPESQEEACPDSLHHLNPQ